MNADVRTLSQIISEALNGTVSAQTLSVIFSVALILIIGIGITRILFNTVKRFSRKRLPLHNAAMLENFVKYGGYTVVLLTAAKRAGIDVSALLGAAGIAGIALGFAAQTSVSNLISGLFLISERAFKIGDVLQIDAITGTVESIDLMSIRIRTFDNRLVRVPNEALIKSNVINVTFYPQRRLDIWLSLPYGPDYAKAMEAIGSTIDASPLALKDPAPLLLVDSASQDGVSLLVGVWFKQEDFVDTKNQIIPAVLESLSKMGIQPQARRIEVSSTYPSPGTSRGD